MPISWWQGQYGLLFICLAAGGAALCVGAAAAALARLRDPSLRRLDEVALDLGAGGAPGGSLGAIRRSLLALVGMLAAPARPQKNWQMSQMRRELMAAGFQSPAAVNFFLVIRMACTAIPTLLILTSSQVTQYSSTTRAMILSAAAVIGFLAPGIFLEYKGRGRKNKIARELPEVLDLLVIAVEAGLGLDAAVKRVAREISLSCPIMARELKLVSYELKAGIPRDKAFKNLAERCLVDDVSGLVTMLNQADRFGVSVGRSLRVHSDTVRTKWRQKMEEKAAKVPLKLLFPVLFMIFPAIMVVMAGPALIFNSFQGHALRKFS